MRRLLAEEHANIATRIAASEQKMKMQLALLETTLSDADPHACTLEVRAGVGGAEAASFAAELFAMYARSCANLRWTFDVVVGGADGHVALVCGEDVQRKLGCESGVHRVQRVPETSAAGCTHTSTATVAVLPQRSEAAFCVDAAALHFECYRASSGPGGQHANKTATAVRITHRPTGLQATSTRERCQEANRRIAVALMHFKLSRAFFAEGARRREDSRRRQVSFVCLKGGECGEIDLFS